MSTRSGPEYLIYPMGRETVLAPVTWRRDEWPIWGNISAEMTGWPMPPVNKNIRGSGYVGVPHVLNVKVLVK